MWRYVKKFFLLFIDVVFDIRKVEKDRWCTMQTLSEDRCSNFPCEDIDGKNMASAFCSCTPGPPRPPPPVVLPSKTYIPWMSVEKTRGHIRSDLPQTSCLFTSYIRARNCDLCYWSTPQTPVQFFADVNNHYVLYHRSIYSQLKCLKRLYIITQYYDQIYTIMTLCKHGLP